MCWGRGIDDDRLVGSGVVGGACGDSDEDIRG